MKPSHRLAQIVYNSNLIIDDYQKLSTLCLFYDTVFLPFSKEGEMVVLDRPIGYTGRYRLTSGATTMVFNYKGRQTSSGSIVYNWDKANQVLFQEGALQRLDAPPQRLDTWQCFGNADKNLALTNTFGSLLDANLVSGFHSQYESDEIDVDGFFIWAEHIEHLLRTDIGIPQIFDTQDERREAVKAVMAETVISYLLPQMSALQPDEIIELRSALSSTREGFSMHLQSLTAKINEAILSDEPLSKIEPFAKGLVETTLLPDYYEFKRQILARASKFGDKVIDAAGKILEIDVAPWTPKFYGDLLKAVRGLFTSGMEELNESRSNQRQAYNFMKTIDESASRTKA